MSKISKKNDFSAINPGQKCEIYGGKKLRHAVLGSLDKSKI
jgi:hypothetical protein